MTVTKEQWDEIVRAAFALSAAGWDVGNAMAHDSSSDFTGSRVEEARARRGEAEDRLFEAVSAAEKACS